MQVTLNQTGGASNLPCKAMAHSHKFCAVSLAILQCHFRVAEIPFLLFATNQLQNNISWFDNIVCDGTVFWLEAHLKKMIP